MDTAGGKKLLTTAEYEELGRQGFFDPEERVELIEGEVLPMSPIGPRHAGRTNYLTFLLYERLGRRVVITVQNPIVLSEITEPQPDVLLLHPHEDFYTSRHPTPADVYAYIEVADTSHAKDRRKGRLCAQAGVREFWLVDVRNDHIEIWRDPGPDGYAKIQVHRRGETVSFLDFPDLPLAVSDILGDS